VWLPFPQSHRLDTDTRVRIFCGRPVPAKVGRSEHTFSRTGCFGHVCSFAYSGRPILRHSFKRTAGCTALQHTCGPAVSVCQWFTAVPQDCKQATSESQAEAQASFEGVLEGRAGRVCFFAGGGPKACMICWVRFSFTFLATVRGSAMFTTGVSSCSHDELLGGATFPRGLCSTTGAVSCPSNTA
jgi:hypothetical protein